MLTNIILVLKEIHHHQHYKKCRMLLKNMRDDADENNNVKILFQFPPNYEYLCDEEIVKAMVKAESCCAS